MKLVGSTTILLTWKQIIYSLAIHSPPYIYVQLSLLTASNAESVLKVQSALLDLQNVQRLEISIYERAADSGRTAVICSRASFAKIMTGAIWLSDCESICVSLWMKGKQAKTARASVFTQN